VPACISSEFNGLTLLTASGSRESPSGGSWDSEGGSTGRRRTVRRSTLVSPARALPVDCPKRARRLSPKRVPRASITTSLIPRPKVSVPPLAAADELNRLGAGEGPEVTDGEGTPVAEPRAVVPTHGGPGHLAGSRNRDRVEVHGPTVEAQLLVPPRADVRRAFDRRSNVRSC